MPTGSLETGAGEGRSRLAATVTAFVLAAAAASAHEGPPFPLIVDAQVGPFIASVWTDPDIGTGTFFVILEPPDGGTLPEHTVIRIAVRPASGRLEETVYQALPQRVRHGQRYFTEVEFDRGELWDVRVELDGPQGGGQLRARVEATPPGGIGPIGLVLYPLPFLAIGFLWFRAALLKRRVREAGDH